MWSFAGCVYPNHRGARFSSISFYKRIPTADSYFRHHFKRRDLRSLCCPHGFNKHIIPLALTIAALILTGIGSWSCNYFSGATIGFTGGSYGIWTIQDSDGKCQLWDVLFFSYNLDPALITARVMSMSAMMMGLAMVVTMAQAMQYHIASWGCGFALFLTFIVSLSTTSIFNVWMVFWLFTYIIYVLIVRSLFIHPIHRRISDRGSRYISICFVLCTVLTILTLVVLKSDYCTCSRLTTGQLEGRITGDPCEGTCRLTIGGYMMILSSFCWLAAAIATRRVGVQPEEIHDNPTKSKSMYGDFQHKSIRSHAKNFTRKMTYSRGASKVSESNDDAQSDTGYKRTCGQKMCCDFRVQRRTGVEKCLYWTFRVGLAFFFLIYMLVIVVLIGSRIENSNAERAPDTTPNFILDPVCAFNPLDTAEPFVTFSTAAAANESGLFIAHCGPCAFCSNIGDIQTYVETRKTVAASAKTCGATAVLGSYDAVVECLEDRIDFSRECTCKYSGSTLLFLLL